MYIHQPWIQYLVRTWFAQSAVILAESGDSIAAILKIDMTTRQGWSCVGEI